MIADPEGPSFIVRTVEHRRYSDGAFVTHDPKRLSAMRPIAMQQTDVVCAESASLSETGLTFALRCSPHPTSLRDNWCCNGQDEVIP